MINYTLYLYLLLCYTINSIAQLSYGLTIDEKFGIQKNRVGMSGYCQGKRHGKIGLSFTYNYATYKYPSSVVHLNNSGTGYIAERTDTPPYWHELASNTTSEVKGLAIELFNNLRIKTYQHSNVDLKISVGYGKFADTYTTYFFGEKRKGNFAFDGVMCNMYFTYLIWNKKIGIEPLLGIAYYYPLLRKNYYLSPNPFVAAELEAGVSFYYKKKRNHQH